MTPLHRADVARRPLTLPRQPARRSIEARTLFEAAETMPPRSGNAWGSLRRRGGEESPRGGLLMLDIETVPDAHLTPPNLPPDRFPKSVWHEIVAISIVEVGLGIDRETGAETYAIRSCRSGGEPGWSEAQLLRAFWRLFEAGNYRLCTWNGRTFDMPTILARSMRHGLAAPAYFQRGTKWANYGRRDAQDWHLDLMDAISAFGASSRLTLEEAAASVGAPGKMGEHGSCVADLVARGELDRVRAYCETDVVNTYVVFLRWAFLTGRTDATFHDRAVDDLLDHLDVQGATRPHLAAFARQWRENGTLVPAHVGRRSPGDAAAATA